MSGNSKCPINDAFKQGRMSIMSKDKTILQGYWTHKK